ncbi:MAG: DUF448 domain-containing protein [Magnetococcales bacterium]|nr:DUF448 domain-containing protein [Magnetococcales bacterium]MBF0438960.1 DUF448 domain-containing protein [Magnetococcales bacterium]
MRNQPRNTLIPKLSEQAEPSRDGHIHGDEVPWRRCAITRNRRPKEQLLRFVVDPQGRLTEDLAGRLPGRGIYVIPDQKRVTALLARHKISGEEAETLLARLKLSLEKRLMDGVGLARRAKSCQVGLREVEELLKRGQRPLLLLATDAGSIQEKLAHVIKDMEDIEVLKILDRAHLSSLWAGREVTLAAITNPGVGQRIRMDAARWRSLKGI